MPRTVLVLVLICGVTSAHASTDDPANARDTDACQADIHRLCDKFFPDEKLVATCLVDRRANLSQACAEVLSRPSIESDQDN